MPGYVYFVEDDMGRVKIGKASNVKTRLSSLQTGNAAPLNVLLVLECKTIESAGQLERFMHQHFGSSKVRNEWFQRTEQFNELIRQLQGSDCKSIAGVGIVSINERMVISKATPAMRHPNRDSRDDLALYPEAVELVQRIGKASIGLLQRRLGIGYERAKRLITLMHVCGVIGAEEKAPHYREVYRQ